jgi:uncharacterized cupin superfamily protein
LLPAGQKVGHALVNPTDAPCRYLARGNPHQHDAAVFPETGRVSAKLAGEGDPGTPIGYGHGVAA